MFSIHPGIMLHKIQANTFPIFLNCQNFVIIAKLAVLFDKHLAKPCFSSPKYGFGTSL